MFSELNVIYSGDLFYWNFNLQFVTLDELASGDMEIRFRFVFQEKLYLKIIYYVIKFYGIYVGEATLYNFGMESVNTRYWGSKLFSSPSLVYRRLDRCVQYLPVVNIGLVSCSLDVQVWFNIFVVISFDKVCEAVIFVLSATLNDAIRITLKNQDDNEWNLLLIMKTNFTSFNFTALT